MNAVAIVTKGLVCPPTQQNVQYGGGGVVIKHDQAPRPIVRVSNMKTEATKNKATVESVKITGVKVLLE